MEARRPDPGAGLAELTDLLDTDHVSILERPGCAEYAPLVANLNLHTADGIGAAVASLYEQFLGAHDRIVKARTPEALLDGYQNLLQVLHFFRGFPLVPYDAAALAKFADLKAQKVRIGTMDLRIAPPPSAATSPSSPATAPTSSRCPACGSPTGPSDPPPTRK